VERGRALQIESMKPMLKARGTECWKRIPKAARAEGSLRTSTRPRSEHDLNFAFNFNLGHYSSVQRLAMVAGGADIIAGAALHDPTW
jgi:hypothetical protein